ncbi:MAG: TolC family protein [Deltaproteobacteria bacterium]|nr:TolC family protein [Deltaproteobacteria bacterium]
MKRICGSIVPFMGAAALSLVVIVLPAGVARAEAPPASSIKVTWPDIERLVDDHPLTTAARLKAAAARGTVDAAGAVPNPSLEASTTLGQARDADRQQVEWELALDIPLGWLAQRSSKIAAAEAEVDVAVSEAKVLRRDVLLQLGVLFWNLAYEQDRAGALGELARQTGELLWAVRSRVEKGEARPVEKTRVQVEAEKLAAELEAARTAFVSRQRRLALWLGVQRGQTVIVEADLTKIPAAPDLEAVRAKVRATHPALDAARARVRTLAAELDAERLARVPAISVRPFTAHELDKRAYGVGLAIGLPVWNWNSGRIAQAEGLLAAGQSQLEAGRLEVESQVIEAQAACQSSAQLASRYKDPILPGAESAAATVEKTYQLGEASLLEVIDARRTLLDTRRQYLTTLVQAQLDCLRLRTAVGEDLP